ncbi:MAG TPA: hypothetical protein VLW53_09495 [Candidatus Eisenbacteria bacterium]|nr:hypothetical protein [Candidatus Eisenbacteria bacterium]
MTWVLATAMLALAAPFVLRPLLRRTQVPDPRDTAFRPSPPEGEGDRR